MPFLMKGNGFVFVTYIKIFWTFSVFDFLLSSEDYRWLMDEYVPDIYERLFVKIKIILLLGGIYKMLKFVVHIFLFIKLSNRKIS